jgi:hypothetical protein
MAISDLHKQAMQYIHNAGGAPEVEWFDDDHEPIGPNLRNDLAAAGMVSIISSPDEEERIVLTGDGKKFLGLHT